MYNAMCCSHGCVILLPYPSMAISIFLIIITIVEIDEQSRGEEEVAGWLAVVGVNLFGCLISST